MQVPLNPTRKPPRPYHQVLRLCALLIGFMGSVAPLGATEATKATEVKAAVAANFSAAMNELSRAFAAKTGQRVIASFGASGQLYAQISNGAPFDIFLAADNQYAAPLIAQGLAPQNDTPFIYALGKLALWSAEPAYVDNQGQVLRKAAFEKIALANPKTAPYGRAAVQTLQAMGLYEALKERFITGENVGQTQQFIATGNVPLGFVALAQINALPAAERGSYWLVPSNLYEPLAQQAILLSRAQHNTAARAFLNYLKSPEARAIMRDLGYDAPQGG